MGNSSSSSVTNENNTLIVNETDIQVLNKSLNNFITNTTIEDAKKCSAGISQLQTVKFKGVKTTGDFNLNLNQKQAAALTFDCLQTSTVRNEIANQMMQSMMDKIENTNSSDVLNKMESLAAAKQTSGFLSTSFGSSTSSDASNKVNYTQRNTTHQNLQNIVENAVQNNFTTKNLSECISKINQDQNVEVINLDIGGNVNAVIAQDQAAELFSQCIQTNDIGNSITQALTSDLGVETKTTNAVKTETDMKGTAESVQENRGPLESLGALFGSLFASFGGGWMGSCMSCIICIVLIVVGIFVFKKLTASKDNANNADNADNADNTGDNSGDNSGNVAQEGGYLRNTFGDIYSILNKKMFYQTSYI